MSRTKVVIFSDLDGCFLDASTYSYSDSLPALNAALARGVPVDWTSSKTRAEIEELRSRTGADHPFIAENGGAAYVPTGYLGRSLEGAVIRGGYEVLELGTPYPELVAALGRIRSELGCELVGFSDLTAGEVAADTGLSVEAATLAKQREWDEAFRLDGDLAALPDVVNAIERAGLKYTRGGRYHHLLGNNDKGRAVALLTELYASYLGSELTTVGIGDAQNDIGLLNAVDRPYLVQGPDGNHDRTVLEQVPGVRAVEAIGPRGWRIAVEGVLAEIA